MDEKTIDALERGGFLRSKYRDHLKIYEYFKGAYVENGYCEAVRLTSENMPAAEKTVEKIVTSFKKMYDENYNRRDHSNKG